MSGCPGDALSALVDGALSHDDRERVQAHLAGCDTCRAEVEAERALKSRLSALSTGTPAPPGELLDRLRGLAVPGVEPAERPAPRRGVPVTSPVAGPTGPALRRPEAGRPPLRHDGRARRRAPRARRTGAIGGSVLLVGVGLALALGGPVDRRPSTPVDPGSDAFVVDFVSTTTEAPLADPAGGAALLPRR